MPINASACRHAARVTTVIWALGLSGCGHLLPSYSLTAGVSRYDDVIASQGPPSRIWAEADGGRTLEYATQPFGTTCFMFNIDAQGRMLAYHDALLASSREMIKPGMSAVEVTRLLGRERRREPFVFSGEDVWDWNVQPDASGDPLRFNVHFKDGQVLRTSYSLELRNKGGPHR